MRKSILLPLAAIAVVFSMPGCAQTASPVPVQGSASPVPSTSASSSAIVSSKYTTAATEVGVFLDDLAAKAIVEKNMPGFTTNEQVDQARGMTLKQVQQYAPDSMTDAVLAKIDADFAKLTN